MSWEDISNNSTEHLSVSQINMFQRCPKQYEYRYVKGIIAPPTSSLILGTSVHKGCEINYQSKFKSRKAADLSDVLDAFSDAYDHADTTELDKDEKEAYKKGKDNGIAMSKCHYKQLAPSVVPLSMPEEEFLLKIDGVKRPILGYIDVYAKIFGGTEPVVIDQKTSRAKWTQWQADCSLQLKIYKIAKAKQLKTTPDKISAAIDNILNQKVAGTQRLFAEKDVDTAAIVKCIQDIEKIIDMGLFYPTYNHQNCSWCGYAHICRPSIYKRRQEMQQGK